MRYFIFLGLALVAGCNIYAPFQPGTSDDDYVELARKAIYRGEYSSAIALYQRISDTTLKNKKLCQVYLVQAGLTMSAILAIATNNGNSMLGTLSNALVPYTAEKLTAASSAITSCAAFATLAPTNSEASLFKTMSRLTHCSLLIAKADQYVTDGTANCSITGPRTGRIIQSTIADNGNGSITAKGMCSADVNGSDSCLVDMQALNAAELQAAGLTAIATAIQNIPAALISGAGGADGVRQAIMGTLPSS